MLNIEVNKKGIRRIYAATGSIATSDEIGELVRATALPSQLLHNSVVEYFAGKGPQGDSEELADPIVWIPTNRDGELDLPRRIVVKTAMLPRDAFDYVPDWFTEGCKKLFPGADWANAETPLSKEVLLSLHSKEYVEAHKDLSEAQLNELAEPVYCSRTEELAVSLFYSRVNSFGREKLLDHWGWCRERGIEVLVSEPYAVDQEVLVNLAVVCEQLGWKYKIHGTSGH